MKESGRGIGFVLVGLACAAFGIIADAAGWEIRIFIMLAFWIFVAVSNCALLISIFRTRESSVFLTLGLFLVAPVLGTAAGSGGMIFESQGWVQLLWFGAAALTLMHAIVRSRQHRNRS